MNLQKKILISFLIMILTPCIIIGILGFIATGIGIHGFRTGNNDTIAIITQPIHALTELTQTEYNELSSSVVRFPDRMDNEKWLSEMNKRLKTKFSYIVVVKDEKEIFVGDRDEYDKVRTAVLTGIASRGAAFDGAVYVNGEEPVLVKHGNVSFSDGSEGYFLIVTEATTLFKRMTRSFATGVIIGAVLVAIMAAALIAWINDSIFKPLEKLRIGTREIGAGNLNFKLSREQNDEIGQLCNDFEEMRRHLKTQIDQREQYEQDVREMISNVSHDLKTPLTAIKGYAEGLLDGVADNKERQDKYLRTIVVKATDMTLLVDELSYYSKLDNNKLPYNFEKVNAVGYFGDCAESYANELEMKDFTVKFISEIDPETVVSIDCEQIRRVMNNLIGNSVKYRNTEVHGKIDIKLTDSGDSVRISVSDNGIGISKEAQPHIFERFYRADKSRTSGRAGTGIGLAIVDKIIKEHKGRVFVKSELGKGTTISFTVKKGA